MATPPRDLKRWALAGIEFDKYIDPGAWKTVIETWKKNGITGEEAWFDVNPNHRLTQFRDFCKKRQDNTIGAGNSCSIRKLYIDLQRPPYGLLGVPHSAFVLGFVLKTWLTGQRKLQWTDGVTSKPLDATTLAEIIEAVVKDDGANALGRNEKLICRLSKEDKAFIEYSSRLFEIDSLEDGTVEATLNAIGTRLEEISQRVPLWVLPDYIHSQDDPNAENMCKIIDALCAANSISSKGDTVTRGNKVNEIGGIFLATPGLTEAMAKYMIPLIFEEAFQRYIDNTKPELKEVVERMGGLSHTYCSTVKSRFTSTSGWLWKRGDAEAVLEEVYKQTLCAEHIQKLVGTSGYIVFADAVNRLRKAVLEDNKVPMDFWAKKYPALQRFFELLSRSLLSMDDVIVLEEILTQQAKIIREIFFELTQANQLNAMKEIFGEIWPTSLTDTDSRELYDVFSYDSANLTEQTFKAQGRSQIEKFRRNLVSTQLKELWREQTDTDSPIEWSAKHTLPAECIFAEDNANVIIDAVNNPNEASAERLYALLEKFKNRELFLNVSLAGENFLKRVLPQRYLKIGFSVDHLSAWLCREIGENPNGWLTDINLRDAVESFVKQQYDTQIRPEITEKIKELSDSEAKTLLLKLVVQIPDVGLSILEQFYDVK